MRDLPSDLRQAWRRLRRSPGLTCVLILSLAFGIGSVVTMAAVCDGLLFRPAPFDGAERQYAAYRVGKSGTVEARLDGEEFKVLREQAKTIEDVVGHCYLYMTFRDGGESRYVSGVFLPANIFDFLGIRPLRGRGFERGDDQPGAPDVCVISHELWQRQFGGRDDVIGRMIVLDDIPRTVVGVFPPDSDFIRHHDLWVPLKFEQVRQAVSWSRGAAATVKLRPGVTREQAAAELAVIGEALQAGNPGKYSQPWTLELARQPRDSFRRSPELLTRYGALFGVAVLVLVIACANVINLLLVQAARRNHDFTVRSALGASRARLIRQMLVESLAIATIGALLGLALSSTLLDFLWASLATIEEPAWMRFRIDWRVLAAAGGVAALVGIGVGLVPAWRASRVDLVEGLKDGARGASSQRLGRISRLFAVLQVALACAVLSAVAVSLGSIFVAKGTRLPFDPDAFLAVRVQIRDTHYRTVGDRARFYSRLLTELRAQPGIAAAAATSRQLDQPPGTEPIAASEDKATPLGSRPRALSLVCSPGYFAALNVPLLRGRDFTEADAVGRPAVCIINMGLAERLFPQSDPIGRTVVLAGEACTVVGLVPSLQEQGLSVAPGESGGAGFYRPQGQAGFDFLTLVLRSNVGAPAGLMREAKEALARVDASVPIFEAMPWGRQVEQGFRLTRFLLRISVGFGCGALLLAALGVYAVIAFAAEQRAREIGIRVALGATPRDVLRLIAREGAGQIGWGLTLGAVGAWGVAHLLAASVYPFPAGPGKYLIVLGTVACAAGVAVLLPARRSARLDPAELLHR